MSIATKIRGLKEMWRFDNRIPLVITRLLFPGETLLVYKIAGIEFVTDHARGDANGAREILTSLMYKRFLPEIKNDLPANVLDLGSSNGGFPLLLQISGVKLKKVVSLELNPETFTRLRFNLDRNLSCETIAINAAVCGETRTLRVELGKGSVSDNIYSENLNLEAEVKEVPGISFDDLYERCFAGEIVDICKLDVEGAEFEILQTENHKALRKCRYLIMEIHERPGRTAGDILPVLDQLGFVARPQEPGSDTSVYFLVNQRLVR